MNHSRLRRYTTEEYQMALMSCLWGADGQARYNEMENLEALHFRGFVEDEQSILTQFIHPGSGIRICDLDLGRKGLWKYVDDVLADANKRAQPGEGRDMVST